MLEQGPEQPVCTPVDPINALLHAAHEFGEAPALLRHRGKVPQCPKHPQATMKQWAVVKPGPRQHKNFCACMTTGPKSEALSKPNSRTYCFSLITQGDVKQSHEGQVSATSSSGSSVHLQSYPGC